MSYPQAKKVTLISLAANGFLAISKMLCGLAGGSHGLFADGVHSLSDLLTDFLVLLAAKYGSQEADANHPYGHQRIETAATLFLSIFLAMTGCIIFYDAFINLSEPALLERGQMVLLMLVISIGVNEGLFYYTYTVGKKLRSQMLIANAWHHRSDSWSSLVVLLGAVGSLLGVVWLDSVAAMLVAVLIIRMGWSIGWNSMQELVDRGIEPEQLQHIEEAISQTPGVVAVHQLRTRLMGAAVLVDVHVLVDKKLTVSEGHYIGQRVASAIRDALSTVKDVTVHIDPEDDEIANPSKGLPSRQVLLPLLWQHWQGFLLPHEIERINLHYLDGKVNVECFLSPDFAGDYLTLKEIALSAREEIASIHFYKALH